MTTDDHDLREACGVVGVYSRGEDVARVAGLLLAVELQPGRLFRLVGVGVSGFEESVPEEDVLQPRLAGFE